MAKNEAEATAPIRELDEAIAALRALERPIANAALTELSEALVADAKFEAPKLKKELWTKYYRGGNLKKSHFTKKIKDGERHIGANISYAQVVHETHPTKKHWFLNVIVKNALPYTKRAIARALERSAARLKGGRR